MGCDCDDDEEMVMGLYDELGILNPKGLVGETPYMRGGDVEEPQLSVAAAAVVADTMEVAEGGRAWL